MDDVREQLAELIKSTRKQKGFTQKELGERLGISESAINKYESGKENPTVQVLQKVAEALGMKLVINFREP